MSGGSQSSLSAGDEKFIPADDKQVTPAVNHIDEKARKSGRFKMDVVITGFSTLVYLMSFLDKANLGNANAAGLSKELGISSRQYSIVLTIFYIPYILAEYPAALLMKKLGPHIMLPALTLSFGLVTALQGLVTSYGGLIACRLVLAVTEGGIIPSLCLYLSNFYATQEYQLRCTILFSAITLAGAFAGLFAAALVNLDGTLGHSGWAWIFIIEGVLTIVVALAAFVFMTPSIEKSWWLKPEEKVALRAVMNASSRAGEEHGKFSWKECMTVFKHPFGLLCWILNMCMAIILFSMAYFLPTIVRGFGYNPTITQLRTVPPYAVVFVVTLLLAPLSDKKQIRGPLVSFYGGLAIIGCAMQLTLKSANARYAAIFLQIFGGYGTSPAISCWMVDNAAPHYARATMIAWCFTFTQIGGIISTWIYPTSEAPYYPTGAKVSMFASVVLFVFPWILDYMMLRANKQREKKMAELPADHVFPEGPIGHMDGKPFFYVFT
ncbi:MFS general substrate transporter [Cystobasidium minutum MCA 4210]|uniref:MFS general substrate transporter n=1 Tax=Cystobasidium minutum MCA 4210 TaxID=1397322 RepID=UPI0034CE6912|eukprot:jgi/Rhomi1/97068/CE97067_142